MAASIGVPESKMDPSGKAEVFTTRKDDFVDGTWEDAATAFHCFLDSKPAIFGSYGFYCTPHIGTYQHEDYTPALPIALASVPVVDEKEQLPASISGLVEVLKARGMLKRKLECYIMIHSGLERKTCAHLRCDNTDEFNLMFHPWFFQNDHNADTGVEITGSLHVGVFEPHGIKPVHQDLPHGGAIFNGLGKMTVILHDRRFSPDNANIQLDHSTDTPVFFSFAFDPLTGGGVITLHILPVGDPPADKVREWIKTKSTVGEFLEGLSEHIPVAHGHATRLLKGVTASSS